MTTETAEYHIVRAVLKKELDSISYDIDGHKDMITYLKTQMNEHERKLSELTISKQHLAAFLERTDK